MDLLENYHFCSFLMQTIKPCSSILSSYLKITEKNCFLSETSQMPNARFQAAGAIGDAAIREWGILTYDNKKTLVL